MKDNLKNILSNLNTHVDQETLLAYLQGKLAAEQQHELEKQMLEDDFDADALDGLQSIQNSQDISHIVNHLNAELKKTAKKKNRREKQEIRVESWIWITILIILLLVVISYVIIHQSLQHQ